MRVNHPVTNTEYPIDDSTLILSTTDTKGRLTFVNPTFIEVSGFTEEELIGKAHNIVRHPDMPPEAFADLWETLEAGQPWTGLVKNRRKNGDYYWVLGNATPIKENGKIVGYLSARTKPPRELIDTVAPIYRQFIEGKAKNLKIHKGGVVRTDLIGKISELFHMTITKRIATCMGIPVLLIAIMGSVGLWAQAQTVDVAWLESFFIATTIGGGLLTAILGYTMAQNITKPLRDINNFSNTLAAGDLRTVFTSNRTDEFGELFKSINQLSINLRTTVSDVRTNAQDLQIAASEIASGNLDLSQRTEKQAASLEETSSSMEELTSTVRQNADNSKQADQLAITASDIAAKGGNMMTDVVSTMSLISDSSNKIADIISVIDSIAFQTNILALNAAVEAARAGEQGRGFAVVATEVRNLAQKSAAAAKEIKTLIDHSVETVDSGAKLVSDAGKTMEDIVISINQVTDIMSEITNASQEQSLGISQINQAITHMDEVTQQNAALVEQATASAESLDMQAKDLIGAISIFKVSGSTNVEKQAPVKTAKIVSSRNNTPTSTAGKQYSKGGKPVTVDSNKQEWKEF